MPELPEVENVRRILSPHIEGKTIVRVEIPYPKMVKEPLESFKAAVIGASFERIERRGKYLIFVLSNGKAILSHLRMEGHFRLASKEPHLGKHDLLAFHLTDDAYLIYNDVRRFGIMETHEYPKIYDETPLNRLGPEPREMDPRDFHRALRDKKGPLKEALLDQSLISGIGNIYADESLFRSGLSPFRAASSLTKEEAGALLSAARDVLEEAIDKGGSTIRSYHPIEGKDGNMQGSLMAYGRAGQKCPRCGATLKKVKLSGRGTTYCPHCQPNPHLPYVVGISGPIASGKSFLSAILRKEGWLELDADRIVHGLYETKAVKRGLTDLFGPNVIASDGTIDRRALLKIIAEDPAKKKALEAYIHPLVYENIRKSLLKAPGKRVVLNVPLLFSSPFEGLCDATILVSVDPALQRKRLLKRGTKDPDRALAVNSSFPFVEAGKRASYVYRSEDVSEEEAKRRLSEIPFLR